MSKENMTTNPSTHTQDKPSHMTMEDDIDGHAPKK
jgi:hypothetical protein